MIRQEQVEVVRSGVPKVEFAGRVCELHFSCTVRVEPEATTSTAITPTTTRVRSWCSTHREGEQ